ncbi:DUF3068 domain-containing protein [Gordonia sp. VNK21]|uniref:DUF3068 domain-containing protein n=1 Tax=Gordonia sp. VNK21 TaxID=3382483 RepID=UPI0038D4D642
MADPRPRLSTRDLLGPLVVFLGAVLLAGALAVGPLLGDGLRAVPMDTDQTAVADGSDGTELLDPCSLTAAHPRVVTGTVQQRRRVVAVRPADDRVLTLQAGTALGVDSYLVDGKRVSPETACGKPTLAATVDRVTVDRSTAAPTGESEIQYADDQAATVVDDRHGYTYLFPWEFDRSHLQYFDPVTRRSLPMRAEGTETMGGRTVVRLVVEVPETDLSTVQPDPRTVLTAPAEWFGGLRGVPSGEELTATLHHRAHRELFVDETTGVIVSETARIEETYRFPEAAAARDGSLRDYRLTALKTTLESDRQTVREAAELASSRSWPVTVVTLVVPIVAGVLGGLLLVAGVWMLRRRPDDRSGENLGDRTDP